MGKACRLAVLVVGDEVQAVVADRPVEELGTEVSVEVYGPILGEGCRLFFLTLTDTDEASADGASQGGQG